MSRIDRRKQAAQQRKDPSLTLLRKQLETLGEQFTQTRNVLFAIVKEQGRVRFSKATIDGLREGDRLDAEAIKLGGEDAYSVTFVPDTMVVPGGVQNGKGVA